MTMLSEKKSVSRREQGEQQRAQGCYYTAGQANPFALKAFRAWGRLADLPQSRVLEPFAGQADLLRKLESVGLLGEQCAYDIVPAAKGVKKRDTLQNFPQGFEVCVTNPPWLARNSASLRGLPFPACAYDDLYKHALERCLHNCAYVAALIPESFIRSFARVALFRERLHSFVSLTGALFDETAHPVGLAMFLPDRKRGGDVLLYRDEKFLGKYKKLQKSIPSAIQEQQIRFNDPCGKLGLFALDNTKEASIRFCLADEVKGYQIDTSSRAITLIDLEKQIRPQFVEKVNALLKEFRDKTQDVFLTAYRGLRADGMYRRRLDWGQARNIIEAACC